ncbi:MAG: hypothetical protein ACRDSK_31265 [Actinophytocola sp.]|uniref:hypothetical protein n=1 Tax=Actinophytocola sp. TaxID=1872138 RepID=UPI003D6ABCC4
MTPRTEPKPNIAAARRSTAVEVDAMTQRTDADALFNQFVSIDLSNRKAKAAVEAVIGKGRARFGNGDYGVLTAVGETDDDGYPVTVTVTLRDDTGAQVPGVPYAALAPAVAGRR